MSPADIVIVEGYKNESHAKIEVIKENSQNYLFNNIKNVKAIISEKEINTDLKQFKKNEIDHIVKFILNEL